MSANHCCGVPRLPSSVFDYEVNEDGRKLRCSFRYCSCNAKWTANVPKFTDKLARHVGDSVDRFVTRASGKRHVCKSGKFPIQPGLSFAVGRHYPTQTKTLRQQQQYHHHSQNQRRHYDFSEDEEVAEEENDDEEEEKEEEEGVEERRDGPDKKDDKGGEQPTIQNDNSNRNSNNNDNLSGDEADNSDNVGYGRDSVDGNNNNNNNNSENENSSDEQDDSQRESGSIIHNPKNGTVEDKFASVIVIVLELDDDGSGDGRCERVHETIARWLPDVAEAFYSSGSRTKPHPVILVRRFHSRKHLLDKIVLEELHSSLSYEHAIRYYNVHTNVSGSNNTSLNSSSGTSASSNNGSNSGLSGSSGNTNGNTGDLNGSEFGLNGSNGNDANGSGSANANTGSSDSNMCMSVYSLPVFIILNVPSQYSQKGQVFCTTPGYIQREYNIKEYCSLKDFVVTCQMAIGPRLCGVYVASSGAIAAGPEYGPWPVDPSWALDGSLSTDVVGFSGTALAAEKKACELYIILSVIEYTLAKMRNIFDYAGTSFPVVCRIFRNIGHPLLNAAITAQEKYLPGVAANAHLALLTTAIREGSAKNEDKGEKEDGALSKDIHRTERNRLAVSFVYTSQAGKRVADCLCLCLRDSVDASSFSSDNVAAIAGMRPLVNADGGQEGHCLLVVLNYGNNDNSASATGTRLETVLGTAALTGLGKKLCGVLNVCEEEHPSLRETAEGGAGPTIATVASMRVGGVAMSVWWSLLAYMVLSTASEVSSKDFVSFASVVARCRTECIGLATETNLIVALGRTAELSTPVAPKEEEEKEVDKSETEKRANEYYNIVMKNCIPPDVSDINDEVEDTASSSKVNDDYDLDSDSEVYVDDYKFSEKSVSVDSTHPPEQGACTQEPSQSHHHHKHHHRSVSAHASEESVNKEQETSTDTQKQSQQPSATSLLGPTEIISDNSNSGRTDEGSTATNNENKEGGKDSPVRTESTVKNTNASVNAATQPQLRTFGLTQTQDSTPPTKMAKIDPLASHSAFGQQQNKNSLPAQPAAQVNPPMIISSPVALKPIISKSTGNVVNINAPVTVSPTSKSLSGSKDIAHFNLTQDNSFIRYNATVLSNNNSNTNTAFPQKEKIGSFGDRSIAHAAGDNTNTIINFSSAHHGKPLLVSATELAGPGHGINIGMNSFIIGIHVKIEVHIDAFDNAHNQSLINGTAEFTVQEDDTTSGNSQLLLTLIHDGVIVEGAALVAGTQTVQLEVRNARNSTIVAIPVHKTLKYTLAVRFHVDRNNPHIFWVKDAETHNCMYTLFSRPLCARALFPCPAIIRPAAVTYDFTVVTPAEYTSIMPAVASKTLQDEKQTFTEFNTPASFFVSLASLSLVVGRFKAMRISEDPIPFTFWAPDALVQDAASRLGEPLKACFVAMTQIMGMNPYTSLNIVIMPPSYPYPASQSMGTIYISHSLFNKGKPLIEYIVCELVQGYLMPLFTGLFSCARYLAKGISRYVTERVMLVYNGTTASLEEDTISVSSLLWYRSLLEKLPSSPSSKVLSAEERFQAGSGAESEPEYNEEIGYFLMRYLSQRVPGSELCRFVGQLTQGIEPGNTFTPTLFVNAFFNRYKECTTIGFNSHSVITEWFSRTSGNSIDISLDNIIRSICLKKDSGNTVLAAVDEVLLSTYKFEEAVSTEIVKLESGSRKVSAEEKIQRAKCAVAMWTNDQTCLFLKRLCEGALLHQETVNLLDKVFSFRDMNARVRRAWCEVLLKGKYTNYLSYVENFINNDKPFVYGMQKCLQGIPLPSGLQIPSAPPMPQF